jgi:predicted Zn finger-like uncharacterized protein
MIITCQECKTSYNFNANQLQPSGTKVRCTNCQNVFTAYPQPEEAPTLVKAEPVADTQFDTPAPQVPADASGGVDTLDADDLFGIEDDAFGEAATSGAPDIDEFDLAGEDFELPGNDMEFIEEGEPSEADLELTDEDLDLVMDMAPPTMAAATGTTAPPTGELYVPESSELDELDELDDLDELLEDTPSAAASDELSEAAEGAETTTDLGTDLDLEDFDFGDDDDTSQEPPSEPRTPDLEGTDELDLDLDLDLDLGDDDAAGDTATEAPLEEALSLDDDLSLGDAAAPGAAEAEVAQDPGIAVDEFEIEDLDLDLEMDSGDDEIDDLDLDLEMDSGDEKSEAPDLTFELEDTLVETPATDADALDADALDAVAFDAAAGETADDELDLDLDFDLEEESPAAAAEMGGPEEGDPLLELDLGEAEEEEKDTDLTDEDGLSLDLEDLKLMDDDDADTSASTDEELELDLDGDLELAIDGEATQGGAGEDDLDLADLEGILDETEGDEVSADEDFVLEESALFGDDEGGSGGGEEESFDLSELESILDEDEGDADSGLSLEEEPELDLDLESTPTLTSEKEDEDLDLSDFEYLAEDGETAPSDDHFDSGDMELEFQVEDEGSSALEEADAELPPPSEPEMPLAEPEIVPEAAPAAPKVPAGPAPVPKKRGTSKFLIAVLIIVLLLGGGYCAYVLLDGMGIRIPYLSDYLKPEANDPGNLQMTTFDINSRFVDSQVLGRIFVITGKVKNGYDHPRGFVQLTGKLFTKGKNLATTQTVYAGNLISDINLVNLGADELKKRLNNRFGNNRMNSRVEPGKALPFMVVFSTLPEAQLEEFTIEVDTSTTLK